MDMSKHQAFSRRPSLLERAAEIYDFSSAAPLAPAPAPQPEARPEPKPQPRIVRVEQQPEVAPAPVRRPEPAPVAPAWDALEEVAPDPFAEVPAEAETAELVLTEPAAEAPTPPPAPKPARVKRQVALPARYGTVDRAALREGEFILPDAPTTALAEEFRIIKRQLLLRSAESASTEPRRRQTILVCSAQPDEGKTFCALNLALSLATEKDLEVLLVDGDFNKPEILSLLGLENGPGFIDAIADPAAEVNDFVVRTDIDGLSVLPAGRQTNNITELLASERTREVLDALTGPHPRRIVVFDSPPALMASPASVLATHVGQVMVVVRADQTHEADLKEAVGLLSGCDTLSLLLNGAGFAATGRRFGSYYGYGQ
jgi:exopolysaccharide/PEP-CTERM locus tyrosine autokinase